MPGDPDDETSVRARVVMPHGGGQCILSGFPGLCIDITGQALIDPDALELTLQRICGLHAELLLILSEASELPTGAFAALRGAAQAKGLELIFLPIEDFSVPDAAFLASWDRLKGRIHALLDRGGTCALSCQYGAGRSGLIAATLLMERGYMATAAIAHVRDQFHEAIESAAQVSWLENQAPSQVTPFSGKAIGGR